MLKGVGSVESSSKVETYSLLGDCSQKEKRSTNLIYFGLLERFQKLHTTLRVCNSWKRPNKPECEMMTRKTEKISQKCNFFIIYNIIKLYLFDKIKQGLNFKFFLE